MTTRREFLFRVVPAVGALALVASRAQAAPQLGEQEPVAQALGYVTDTRRADQAKYPQHSNAQTCANCQLYGAGGSCSAFPGKTVSANGWCRSTSS